MLLSDILTPARIRVPIQARDKPSVLRELVGLAVGNGGGPEFDEALAAVEAREALLSTGMGYGIAIPHGKCASVPELRLAAGTAPEPVGFDALDGQPVRLFFLLIGPESASGTHVKALSRISRLVRSEQIRERLLRARDPEEFYRFLCEAESR
mgnify:CR=1 FL=1